MVLTDFSAKLTEPRKRPKKQPGNQRAWAQPHSFVINNGFASLSAAKYQQRVNFSQLPERFAQDSLGMD